MVSAGADPAERTFELGGAHGGDGPRDPAGEVGDDPVEGCVLAGASGIGYRPVQPASARVDRNATVGGEFLVGGIADGDHEAARVVGAEDVLDVARGNRRQRDAVPPGRGDRAGVQRCCRVGARGGRRDRAGVVPQRRGELGTRRVVRADEHHPGRVVHGRRAQRVERAGSEGEVGAATVGLRPVPGHHPDCSRTRTWCASRFDGIPSSRCSSVGDASPSSSASTIANRPGSPSAACTAARRTTSSPHSAFIGSILAELSGPGQGLLWLGSGVEPVARAAASPAMPARTRKTAG
jgi:hypothetical protein